MSKKIIENPWKSMKIDENLWKSAKIYEKPRTSMQIPENPWNLHKSTKIRENLRKPKKIDENKQQSMKINTHQAEFWSKCCELLAILRTMLLDLRKLCIATSCNLRTASRRFNLTWCSIPTHPEAIRSWLNNHKLFVGNQEHEMTMHALTWKAWHDKQPIYRPPRMEIP